MELYSSAKDKSELIFAQGLSLYMHTEFGSPDFPVAMGEGTLAKAFASFTHGHLKLS